MKLSAQVSSEAVEQALAQLIQRMENPRPVLTTLAGIYVRSTEQRFESQTKPNGQSWKRLKPATTWKKIFSGLSEPSHIGVWTGRLATSIQWRLVGSSAVQVFTTVPYARTFHYGAPARRNSARPFLGFTKKADTAVQRAMKDFLNL